MPAEWLETIITWAAQFPRIREVYLFGSRAKGTHRAESDLDLAVIVSDTPNDTALGYATCEGDRLQAALASTLPVALDLQFAFPDDGIVMPAVREHGILLYRAT